MSAKKKSQCLIVVTAAAIHNGALVLDDKDNGLTSVDAWP